MVFDRRSPGLCLYMIGRLQEMRVLFDIDGKKQQIEILQEKTIKPDFWDDNQQAQLILKEISETAGYSEAISGNV